MRRFYLLILAATLGGCAASSAQSPGSALLTSWKPLGVSCADPVVGMPDNLPQWRCQATIRGLSVGLEFMADDAGVVDIEAQVPAGTDPGEAKAVFDDLVSSMDAFPSAQARLTSLDRNVDWRSRPDLHGLRRGSRHHRVRCDLDRDLPLPRAALRARLA